MEKNKELRDWLNLLIRPGFYVEEGQIAQVDAAAQGLLLEPGMDIAPLITSGLESYQNFQTGCLYVQLNLSDTTFQGCDSLLENILCRVGKSSINISGIAKSETVSCMLRVMKYIGRCLINRNCSCICHRVWFFLTYVKL